MENCPLSGEPCPNVKNIHVRQESNGKTTEYKCCQDCNPSKHFYALPLVSITGVFDLMNKLKVLQSMQNDLERLTSYKCSSCGVSLAEIQAKGRLGCSGCYESFKDELLSLLPQIHSGHKSHIGKKPPSQEIAKLKEQMSLAVKDEKYEEAAILRDRIKQILERNKTKTPDGI